ncbi:MAG: hypothetical protein FWF82_04910 [Oscillospiraceae bacterium]|nr:hypothetical protein [Oscillospiraceae bacterium]
MDSSIDIRARQKHHLGSLLGIKKANPNTIVNRLDEKISDAVAVMNQEDVAWVEKIVGVTAL